MEEIAQRDAPSERESQTVLTTTLPYIEVRAEYIAGLMALGEFIHGAAVLMLDSRFHAVPDEQVAAQSAEDLATAMQREFDPAHLATIAPLLLTDEAIGDARVPDHLRALLVKLPRTQTLAVTRLAVNHYRAWRVLERRVEAPSKWDFDILPLAPEMWHDSSTPLASIFESSDADATRLAALKEGREYAALKGVPNTGSVRLTMYDSLFDLAPSLLSLWAIDSCDADFDARQSRTMPLAPAEIAAALLCPDVVPMEE